MSLSACTASDPSAHRVAQDLIESLAPTPEIEACMLEVLDGYTKDELESIGERLVSDNPDVVDEAQPELAEFESRLAACN